MRKLGAALTREGAQRVPREHAEVVSALGEQHRVWQSAAEAQLSQSRRVESVELVQCDDIVVAIIEKSSDAIDTMAATVENVPV